MRGTRSAAALAARRRLAVQRVHDGWKRADVAALLGAHPETVAEWVRAHQGGGDAALAAKPHPGRMPFLTADRERQALAWLADKPTAHGFRTDPWAARRVAELIRQRRGRRPPQEGVGPRAVSVSPAARRLGLYFATLPDGYFTAEAVVGLLRDLLRRLRGNVVVVWDGGPHRKGPVVRAFPRRNRRRRLERLPPYAPDWNPVEAVRGWLKYGEPANHVPDGLGDLDDEVVGRRIELKFDPDLLRGSWEASDLPFPTRRRVKQE